MKIQGGPEQINGFTFSTIQCGIRYPGRYDFCVITSDTPCAAAAVFTTNKVKAAPVLLSMERSSSPVHGILINATNANACTGAEGLAAATALCSRAEELAGAPAGSYLNCSTGVIGRQLPVQKMLDALPELMHSRSQDKGALIPDTIMTTDTVRKACCHSFMTSSGERKIAVTAKGAGMIAPNMATLLCFALTDAPVARADLDRIFRSCVNRTLNAISIDGDMSTNDTAIILSPEGESLCGDDLASFETALHDALLDISRQLVKDGEGATKCVDVIVTGAANDDDARRCAKSVAESLLVKTAFFGNDPNWGRIACAAGYSGAELDQSRISISFDDCMILEKGTPVYERLDQVAAVIKKSDFTVTVDLALGQASFRYITSDISFDYVRINAEYST